MVSTLTLMLALAAAPAPAPAPASLTALVEVVDISSLSIAPDGQTVAFRQEQSSLERDAKELSWWVARLDGRGPARRVAEGGQALWNYGGVLPAEPAAWSTDGRFLYYRALIDDQVAVWRAAADASGARQLTRDDADIVSFELVDGGAGLAYATGPSRSAIAAAERQEAERGVRIDATIDPAQNLFGAREVNGRPAAERFNGAWFKRGGLLDAEPKIERRLALEDRAALAGGGASGAQSPTKTKPNPGLSRDGYGTATLEGEGDQRLVRVVRPQGEQITCQTALCRAAKTLAWRPGFDEIVLTVADAGRRQSLVLWRPATGTTRPLFRSPGLIGDGTPAGPCALTETTAVCVASAATTPPKLLAVSLTSGASHVLAAPNLTLEQAAMPATKLMTWSTADGRSFSGWLMTPPGPIRRRPVFITYYLCDGYLRGGTGDEYPLAALAQAGIATLCINKAYQSVSQHDAVSDYRTAQVAIETIVAKLDADGVIDRDRVGMGGFSFGSEVTAWMMMNTRLLRAAAVASTQVEPAYYWFNGAPGRDNHAVLRRSWKLGAPEETPERWREISPALNTDKIHTALLMQMPEQEYRLSFELFARLAATPTPVDLYVFPGEPHNKTRPRHRLAVYSRNLDWFRFWLQDFIDPDPAKADQYRLWTAMAERWRAKRP